MISEAILLSHVETCRDILRFQFGAASFKPSNYGAAFDWSAMEGAIAWRHVCDVDGIIINSL